MPRRQPDIRDLMDPNSSWSKEAREYQEVYERELRSAQARGLTGGDAVAEAQYRASVELPRQREKRQGRKFLLIFLVVIGAALVWAYQAGELSNLRIDAFAPPLSATSVLFFLFFIVQWENQRWVRARSRGLTGASQAFGAFVDLTGFLALVFGIVWPIAYGYDNGWKFAVGLYALACIVSFVVGMTLSTIVGFFQRSTLRDSEIQMKLDDGTMGDSWILWMLSTFAIWPLILLLGREVSWFGFLV